MLQRAGVLRYDRCLGDAVNAWRTLEQGGTDEISIRGGTLCAVNGIVRGVREEILLGCLGGIPSVAAAVAVAAAATGGDEGAGGRLQDKDYHHHLRAIVDNVSAMTASAVMINWYQWQWGERLNQADLLGEYHGVITTFY
jgi:hypothetical protein